MLVTTLNWEVVAGVQLPRSEEITRLRTRIPIMKTLDFLINIVLLSIIFPIVYKQFDALATKRNNKLKKFLLPTIHTETKNSYMPQRGAKVIPMK